MPMGDNSAAHEEEHSHRPMDSAKTAKGSERPLPCKGKADCRCRVWSVLINNDTYHAPLELPTMGGRAANLFFQFNPAMNELHVYRHEANPDFVVNEADFTIICKRYHQGLADGDLPAVHVMGGTGYFTDPQWPDPPLRRIETPYVPPIIRHVFQNNPDLAGMHPCCL